MKLIATNRKDESGSSIQARETGRKVRGQIAAARESILAESRSAFAAPERLLRLAVNEAEALAWQTTYPQLIFPTLAAEKVQALVAWNATQNWCGKAARRFHSPSEALGLKAKNQLTPKLRTEL
jgi:hypothetical protein